jgi:RND superfamily putative drug exporter
MEQLTRWVLRHRRLVVAIWLIVTIVGIATVSKAVNAMDQKFSVPGREGWVTNS